MAGSAATTALPSARDKLARLPGYGGATAVTGVEYPQRALLY
jgi:hypothetical protein